MRLASELKLFAATVFREPWHAKFSQYVKQGTELGKTGLEQVQSDKAGEPEPVGWMKMRQQQGNHDKWSGHDTNDPFNIKFFFHDVTPLFSRKHLSYFPGNFSGNNRAYAARIIGAYGFAAGYAVLAFEPGVQLSGQVAGGLFIL